VTDTETDTLLADVVAATDLPEAVVKGICGGLAASGRDRQDRATMIEMTETWGVPYQVVQQLATLKLDDLRAITDGVASSALLNCAVAQKGLARALRDVDTDEDALGTAKVLSGIASQQSKIAEGWLKQGGPAVMIQNNFGVEGVKQLIKIRQSEAPAVERLKARGIVLEAEIKP
jgi:hypothetical protein